MRAPLLLALLLVPVLAGCADPPSAPRQASFSQLLEAAQNARQEPQRDDVLVAAAAVEGRTDTSRGDGLAPTWAFVFASVSAARIECVLMEASGVAAARHGYPLAETAPQGRGVADAIDSSAAVAEARRDPDFGTAAVRAQRWVLALSEQDGVAVWRVAVASPGGGALAVDVDAREGTRLGPPARIEAAATTTSCP